MKLKGAMIASSMRLNLIIGIALSALSIYYLAKKIDTPELLEAFKAVNILPIIPSIMINFLAIWVRAVRWKYLLKPVDEVRVGSLYYATLVGYMVNMLLPGRLGELLRAYVVGEREKISKLSSLATIVVERLVDSFCIIAILAGVLLLLLFGYASEVKAVTSNLGYYGIPATAFLVGFLILLLTLRTKRDWAFKFFSPLTRILPATASQQFEDVVNAFLDGLDSLKKSKSLMLVIIISIPLWVLAAVANYLLVSSFGIKLPIYGYFFLIIAQALGVVIPTPGYVGTYHLATRTGLVWLGVAEAQAQSLAIIIHASFFIPLIAVGLFYWWLGGLSFRNINKGSPFRFTQ